MRIRRFAFPAAFAAGLVLAPFSTAEAQAYYYPPCSPFPLAWPFCAAGAIVGTAANVVTAPIWIPAGAPPPFQPVPRYYAPPYYAPPPPPPYYYGPR
jgi:hypothetical protein